MIYILYSFENSVKKQRTPPGVIFKKSKKEPLNGSFFMVLLMVCLFNLFIFEQVCFNRFGFSRHFAGRIFGPDFGFDGIGNIGVGY